MDSQLNESNSPALHLPEKVEKFSASSKLLLKSK